MTIRDPVARRSVALAMLVLVALTMAGHTESWAFAAPGLHSLDHHHGPFGECPPIHQHHCVACAAHLFAPAPAVARITPPPQVRRAESRRVAASDSCRSVPIRAGRAPPVLAVLSIAISI